MKRTFPLLTLLLALSGQAALARALPTDHTPRKAVVGAPLRPEESAASKQTAALMPSDKPVSARSGKRGSSKPCYAKPVQLLRVRGTQVEPREVSLTTCSGAPSPSALDSVSVLGRPRDVERPLLPEIRSYRALPVAKGKPKRGKKYRDPMFVTDHVMRLNPGLLVRLQKIAKHYPGKVIEIISGYRPDSRETSRHHHGQALDLRVAGITRERLRDYLRTFEDTGVGYYPNSFFVHMDVRDSKGYWVDRSGPGEPADYGPWPPTKHDLNKTRDSVLKGALADLEGLRAPLHRQSDKRTAMNTIAPLKEREIEPGQEGDDMTKDEVKRARDEARRALEELGSGREQ